MRNICSTLLLLFVVLILSVLIFLLVPTAAMVKIFLIILGLLTIAWAISHVSEQIHAHQIRHQLREAKLRQVMRQYPTRRTWR